MTPLRTLPAVGLLLLVAQAGADEGARAQVEQRLRLNERLIGEVGVGQRIIASGQARAVGHLDESRLHQALAEDALRAGDLATARREADEALRHIGQARRLVPDAPARQAAARARWGQQLAVLDRLMLAWQAHQPPDGAAAPAADIDHRLAATGLIGQARQLGEQARHEEALSLLSRAEQHVLAGLNPLLHQRTLDYTARAQTPAQAYEQALASLASLADLVPLALAELKPRPEAVALIERYADTSRTLQQQAQARQQRGETQQALSDLNHATLYLQRALAAAGLSLPAPVEGGR